jgi:hypothetical protein
MTKQERLRWFFQLSSLVLLIEMSACSMVVALPFGGDSWKEEVLLHDGSKMVIARSQTYGGRHEIGQSPPIKEHTVTFKMPNTTKTITWISEYDESLGRTNFNPLALHILKNTPYIVVTPNLMLSYNKWGRPNPPYVAFKYEGGGWVRIALEEVPPEFKSINLIIDALTHGNQLNARGMVSSDEIKKLNGSLTQEEYKIIHRVPLDHWKSRESERMIRTEGGGWIGIGWFRDQPSLEACLQKCAREKVSASECPCHTLFEGK